MIARRNSQDLVRRPRLETLESRCVLSAGPLHPAMDDGRYEPHDGTGREQPADILIAKMRRPQDSRSDCDDPTPPALYGGPPDRSPDCFNPPDPRPPVAEGEAPSELPPAMIQTRPGTILSHVGAPEPYEIREIVVVEVFYPSTSANVADPRLGRGSQGFVDVTNSIAPWSVRPTTAENQAPGSAGKLLAAPLATFLTSPSGDPSGSARSELFTGLASGEKQSSREERTPQSRGEARLEREQRLAGQDQNSEADKLVELTNSEAGVRGKRKLLAGDTRKDSTASSVAIISPLRKRFFIPQVGRLPEAPADRVLAPRDSAAAWSPVDAGLIELLAFDVASAGSKSGGHAALSPSEAARAHTGSAWEANLAIYQEFELAPEPPPTAPGVINVAAAGEASVQPEQPAAQ